MFEYSHGFALDLDPNAQYVQTPAERRQNVSIYLPYSTGGGIGYRFSEGWNLRAELKVHSYDVARGETRFDYRTVSAGFGLYYFWKPWTDAGLVIVPSLRYWPNVASSMSGDRYRFSDGEVHRAHDFGLFANVSVGLRF